MGLIAVSLAATGCASGGRAERAQDIRVRDITLVARNHNFYDATLYAIGPGGTRQRIGRVEGNSEETFVFRWSPLELRIEIDLLSVGSTLTTSMPIDEGDELDLLITPDLHLRIP